MGYVAFSEVDLCAYTYRGAYKRKQITDFDVLGIRIDPDFEPYVAVAECKSAQDRAMENLLKLHGIQQFFHAHKAYFVQHRIDPNAREVGGQLNITCLDSTNLASLLKSLGVTDQDIALESEVYRVRMEMLVSQKKDFPGQVEYLKYDYWTLPDNRNIINLIRLMTAAAKAMNADRQDHVSLAHQMVTGLALSIIRLGNQIVRTNIDDVQESLLTSLLGGSRERRDREVLFDTIAKAIPDANVSFVPEFVAQLAELIVRYLGAMVHSHRVVACLEDMNRRVILAPQGGAVDLTSRYHDRTLKFARDCLHFCSEVSRLPKIMFALSLKESE
jgi:hypothetical protein